MSFYGLTTISYARKGYDLEVVASVLVKMAKGYNLHLLVLKKVP